MAIFAVHYTYGDDTATMDAKRPEHRAYLGSLAEDGRILASGPYVGDASRALLIFRADSAAEVEALLAKDPFQQAGVVTKHEVAPWNPIIGQFKDLL